MKHDDSSGQEPLSLRLRLLEWRNAILRSPRFQRHAARNPLLRPIARRRARAAFDLVAGFTYTQTLLASVESGLLELLGDGPADLSRVSARTDLSEDAVLRLLRAAEALEIVEDGGGGWWVLGRHGAALADNAGAIAMIRHHPILYEDLANPLAMLRDGRTTATRLSEYWKYSTGGDGAAAQEYSALMQASQAAVAEELLASFPFDGAESLLDVGGGTGAFLRHVAAARPELRLGLFDLPPVIALARHTFDQGRKLAFHEGDFLHGSLPSGYDLVSLVRILHDHDDAPAQRLLENIRASLRPGGRLLIAEPMAETKGAEAMGGAYFGLYLWAMGSGRPRSVTEIRTMLERAGFASSRRVRTAQPIITSAVVATA